MEIHPLAKMFPEASVEDYSGLVEDIRQHGLLEPIYTHGGSVVDGRTRLRACAEAGVAPVFKEVGGSKESLLNFIISKNLHRRHLTASQRAAIAAEMKKHVKHGEADQGEASQEGVASIVGCSQSAVSMADRVLEAAPDLHEQVKTGSLSVHRALAEVKRRKKRAVIAERIDAAEGLHLDAAVHHGDVLDELRKIGAATARLVFADPPYNQGIDYGSGPDADRLSDGVYMTWVEDWLRECLEILTEDGSLWVMISDEYAAEYAVLLRDLGLKVRSWIKWYETFGVNCQNNFNRCSRHLFYCVKDEHKFVFNSDAVTRLSARQERYNDKRAVAGGKLWDNVWQIARLTGTSTERIPDVPTQLPEELLTPVVLCASDPGDLVIDPFAGSGTTGAVCVKNKRKFIGIDNNEEYVRIANSRLKMCSQA